MKNKTRYLNLYRSVIGSTIAHPPILNTISSDFTGRIVQNYSYVPDYEAI